MKQYTTLFLDLDGTLLDFDKSERAAVKKALKMNGLPHDDETATMYAAINKSFWERFERGEIPKSAIFEGRFKELFARIGHSCDVTKLSDEYCGCLAEGHDLTENSIEILTYLKNAGYSLYATTNGLSTTQYRRIKDSGLDFFFDGIFVSEDAGHKKPEKEYFEYVIDHIGEKDRGKMLIVGDSCSSDILGGINAGIDTCWYNPKGAAGRFVPTYEIKNLLDLMKIL